MHGQAAHKKEAQLESVEKQPLNQGPLDLNTVLERAKFEQNKLLGRLRSPSLRDVFFIQKPLKRFETHTSNAKDDFQDYSAFLAFVPSTLLAPLRLLTTIMARLESTWLR